MTNYFHNASCCQDWIKKRLTLSALFYGKRGKLVGANLQLFSDSSNNLRKTFVIIFNFLIKMMASRNVTPFVTLFLTCAQSFSLAIWTPLQAVVPASAWIDSSTPRAKSDAAASRPPNSFSLVSPCGDSCSILSLLILCTLSNAKITTFSDICNFSALFSP